MCRNIFICCAATGLLLASTSFAADCGSSPCVDSWSDLKFAVEKTGGDISLGSDLSFVSNESILNYVNGTVIDGNGYTVYGTGAVDPGNRGQFINFSANKTGSDPIDIKNMVFKNFAEGSTGGSVIYNNFKSTIGDISADFINNYSAKNGGAISNNNQAIMNNISGKFQGNKSDAWGGAIHNSNSIINSITGSFLNNTSKTYGGAIYNGGGGSIGDINADFIGNTTGDKGGAIYGSGSSFSIIKGKFINNNSGNEGGAINSQNSTYSGIEGTFSGNYVKKASGSVKGGAISTYTDIIKYIKGDFVGNYIENSNGYATGGALDLGNNTQIDLIEGTFTGNYIKSNTNSSQGGAIAVSSNTQIKMLKADFVNNSIYNPNSNSYGGAISIGGNSIIETLTGIFTGNTVHSQTGEAWGGAIYVFNSSIGNIVNSSFYNNSAKIENSNVANVSGGAIRSNTDLLITADKGNSEFSGNKIIYKDADGNDVEKSNAIYMATSGSTLKLNAINGGIIKFDDGIDGRNGYLISLDGDSSGKIYLNEQVANTGGITLNNTNVYFGANSIIDSYTFTAESGSVRQAKVNSGGSLIVKSGAEAVGTTVNTGGSLTAEALSKLNGLLANGGSIIDIDSGAILSGKIVIDKNAVMNGSYNYEQIFSNGGSGSLTLVGGLNDKLSSSLVNTVADKDLIFSNGSYAIAGQASAGITQVSGWDGISLENGANVKLEGDFAMPESSSEIYIDDSSILDLSGHSPSNYTITGSIVNDGTLNFSHAGDDADDITTITGNYKATTNSKMNIDVNPALNLADKLIVQGDVQGTTTVIGQLAGADVLPTGKILFVDAPNDNPDTGAAFKIFRVYGSSYKWNAAYENNKWYMATDNIIPDGTSDGYDGTTPPTPPTPPPGPIVKPSVVGEVMAYSALAEVGIEQTRDLFRKVAKESGGSTYLNKKTWASPVYRTVKNKSNVEYEADISGLDAGFELQVDMNNSLGIFLSYRNGKYDLSGNGSRFYSKTKSDIDIDSYIGGLYYTYENSKIRNTAAIFGGFLNADLSSRDGVKADTKGREFGAGWETGLKFYPAPDWKLEPALTLTYIQVNYDKIRDGYGKTARYDTARQLEAEVSVKAEKTWRLDEGNVKAYVKPGLVQRYGSGNVDISGLQKFDSMNNKTLGRIEAGAELEVGNNLSAFANVSHTQGHQYKDTSFNIGLKYSF